MKMGKEENMNSILWFWLGTVVGSFIGFGTFCLLLASRDDIADAAYEEIPNSESRH